MQKSSLGTRLLLLNMEENSPEVDDGILDELEPLDDETDELLEDEEEYVIVRTKQSSLLRKIVKRGIGEV